MITELVKFKTLNTTADKQIVEAVNNLNEFQEKQDGFLDAELVKDINENSWCVIFHYEDFEKVQTIGVNLRGSREFSDFRSLIESESLNISFNHQLRIW